MKIGILTFIDTINYGALLQSYALETVLKKMGHDVQIIQYKNRAVKEREKGVSIFSVRGILKLLVIGNSFKKKAKKFREFEDTYIKRTAECNAATIADICNGFDKIVTGSDQVWNLALTGEDFHYFLDFVTDSFKKISYAPSFGENPLPNHALSKVGLLLKDFAALSVRETAGMNIISKLSGRKADLVLDPTLLLTKEEWKNLIQSKPCEKPYILVYLPHKKDICFSFAKKLQTKTGYEIIYLSISPRIIKGVKTIYDASPQEWLSWMFHADYVITGSFHGTAFSLNFEKQFFYESLGKGSRIDSLVSLTGTENRNLAKADMDVDIDYCQVSGKLSKARQMSLSWLKNAILNTDI